MNDYHITGLSLRPHYYQYAEYFISTKMKLFEAYRNLMDASDPRVVDWPLMDSPFPVLIIVLIYLLFVLHIGPSFMEKRDAYSLNKFMMYYNTAAAITSAIVFYGLLTSGFTTSLSLGCEPVDYSFDPEPMRMAKWVWWTMILKIIELSDTIIFVLRKKMNQVTFLHVYHHAMVVCLAWIGCKYVAGGMWSLNIMTNCIVHVIMYLYYLLTSFGPRMQKKISPCKPYLTMLQMIQFVFMILHTSQALLPSCEISKRPFAYIYLSQVVIVFYLFWDFYKKSYSKKQKSL